MNKTDNNNFNWSFLLICLSVIGYIAVMLIPLNAFADDMKKDVEAFNQKYNGVNAAMFGKVYPAGVLNEINKGKLALRKARAGLKSLLERVEKAGEIPDYATALSGRLDALSNDFNEAVRELRATDDAQTERLNAITNNLEALRVVIAEGFKNLIVSLNEEEEKDQGWSAGVTAYGSAEYATSKNDLMPIGGVGLNLNWRKEDMSINIMLGAGVSSIEGAALSWTFIPSLQFIMSPKFSLGPAIVLTQDLGNMEGADRWVWEVGCKFHTNAFGLGFWALPAVGLHGERGYGTSLPTYSPNVGVTLGVDFTFIK